MQQLSSIFLFYKPFLIWSFGVNIFLLVIGINILSIAFTKILLTLFLWHIIEDTKEKKILKILKNKGFTAFKLFSIIYLIDIFLSVPFLLVLNEFI